MAAFVVAFHWTPADYYRITLGEREAIITEQKRTTRRK